MFECSIVSWNVNTKHISGLLMLICTCNMGVLV